MLAQACRPRVSLPHSQPFPEHPEHFPVILVNPWPLKPSEAQVMSAVSRVFHLHCSQILLKCVANIYCFERIPVGVLIAQKTQFLVLKSNSAFVLSIGGFNQYPPPTLEGDCRRLGVERGDVLRSSLRWVAERFCLQVLGN